VRKRGWTLLELVVSSGLLLLLVTWSTMTLLSFSRTMRGLQAEGDQMAKAAHALEHLQREILRSQPLATGSYQLEEQPLTLHGRNGGNKEIRLVQDAVSWDSTLQGPARRVTLKVWREDVHLKVQIDWEMPVPMANLQSRFDATVPP